MEKMRDIELLISTIIVIGLGTGEESSDLDANRAQI